MVSTRTLLHTQTREIIGKTLGNPRFLGHSLAVLLSVLPVGRFNSLRRRWPAAVVPDEVLGLLMHACAMAHGPWFLEATSVSTLQLHASALRPPPHAQPVLAAFFARGLVLLRSPSSLLPHLKVRTDLTALARFFRTMRTHRDRAAIPRRHAARRNTPGPGRAS